MEEGLNHETLPLLGTTQPHRLHYLDNLRATLTVVLIFHHVAKQLRWLFLALQITTSSFPEYEIGLPASIYALFLRPSLVVILSLAWKSVFGVPGVYTKLSGPTTYVSILLSLDFIYLFLRWCVRQGPNYSDLPF
ncbi:hypothetical protein CPB84DRAFT_1538257 [Gymnopilus junonius]|uniref:Acyltransferase 3 domain-containing protein n=1 Tax=Gymnopilus junonius TaxID=109634 RepID=A0A9P5NF41_GYMJU|nr:hypothetical protein CPB84DRAFT_1538257 [Gymnopilus junonius]